MNRRNETQYFPGYDDDEIETQYCIELPVTERVRYGLIRGKLAFFDNCHVSRHKLAVFEIYETLYHPCFISGKKEELM
jgi:hypothetical protein